MPNTKIRIIIATVAATLAVAPAALALPANTGGNGGTPTTANPGSTETKNDGRYNNGSVNGAALRQLQRCAQMRDDLSWLNDEISRTMPGPGEARSAENKSYLDMYSQLQDAYFAAGCTA